MSVYRCCPIMDAICLFVFNALLAVAAAVAWSTYSEDFERKANDYDYRSIKFQRKKMAERDCYSCMSKQYLLNWHDLLYHYYPPKSFTDDCESPNDHLNMTTIKCKNACITVTENVAIGGVHITKRYMRGCIDRFLLYNMGPDLRREMAAVGPNELCRVINRQMLHLLNPSADYDNSNDAKPEPDEHKDMIEVCSCLGHRCNGSPAAASGLYSRQSGNGVVLRTLRTFETWIPWLTMLIYTYARS